MDYSVGSIDYIGGSSAAAALGVSPWKTPLRLYQEMIRELQPEDISDRESVIFGNLLEDVVAGEYARRTGNTVRRRNDPYVDAEFPWMAGHVDRLIEGEPGLLEVKTTAWFMGKTWGEQDTGDIPPHVFVQCQFYMMISDRQWCDIAVLIGGNKLQIYHLDRDAEFIKNMRVLLVRFTDCVSRREPPDPTTAEDVLLLYPSDIGTSVNASDLMVHTHGELLSVKNELKALADRRTRLEFLLKDEMGEAAMLLGPTGPLATWKASKTKRLDQKKLKTDHPAIAAGCMVETEGRRFLLKGGD